MKKIILGVIVLISVIFGVFMYNKSEYVSSEAVFVATDSLTNLSFKLDGKIKQMTKEAGDDVKKGDVLAVLQTKTLNTKLKEIEYKINSQKQTLLGLSLQKEKLNKELGINKNIINNELNQTKNKIASLNYQILANQSKLKKLKFDTQKFYKLYKAHKISYDKYDAIKTEYEYLKNMINAQKENKKSILIAINILKNKLNLNKNNYKNIAILDKKMATLSNQILSLQEIKKGIMIKLNDSKLLAPFNGIIAKKFVNTDMVIKKGTFIYSIVNPKDIYIKVLLSETKLSGIKVGSKAIVKLDAFDKKFDGKVYKIMPVSASTFSLVPRDIASGEFTKLDQRFIVKIKIPYNKKLRIGMSGDIKIYK